jgi:hypothetical protein
MTVDGSLPRTVGITLHGVVFDIFGMPSRSSRAQPNRPMGFCGVVQ